MVVYHILSITILTTLACIAPSLPSACGCAHQKGQRRKTMRRPMTTTNYEYDDEDA